MMNDKVSVIIPTWNRREALKEAVQSVIRQTFPVHEILVCDDGSDDGSLEWVQSLSDPRVKWIEGPRSGGPAAPRNRGVAHATGDWLAFLDSDDIWLHEKIEVQLKALHETGLKAGSANAWRITSDTIMPTPYIGNKDELTALSDLIKVNSVICSSAIIHRTVLDVAGGFPEDESLRAVEDYALWLRVAALTNLCYISQPLLNYKDDPSSSIRAGKSEGVQREEVMKSFYFWVLHKPIEGHVRTISRRALKSAMRQNGKSFLERWRIK